jgi:hypothetical protein
MNSIAASTQPPLPPFSTAAAAHKPRIQPAREFDVNKRKQMKAKWLLFPFICFHEFFRIGTFQRVTADSNKKIRLGFCSRRGCARTSDQMHMPSPCPERDGFCQSEYIPQISDCGNENR